MSTKTRRALADSLSGFERLLDLKGIVFAMAGRRIDVAGAVEVRFPAENEVLVAQRIHHLLVSTACQAVVSSAACGADILLLERAGALGVKRRVVLPFARDRFRATSVADRDEAWGHRFDAILGQLGGGDVVDMRLSEDHKAYTEANARILEEAVAWGTTMRRQTLAMLVWDGVTRGATDLTDGFRKLALARTLETVSVSTL